MNIYVGNLSNSTTPEQLEDIFSPFGPVSSVKIIVDGFTKRPKGFAFVEMLDEASAEKAISDLQNTMLNEQVLTVNTARSNGQNVSLNRRRY